MTQLTRGSRAAPAAWRPLLRAREGGPRGEEPHAGPAAGRKAAHGGVYDPRPRYAPATPARRPRRPAPRRERGGRGPAPRHRQRGLERPPGGLPGHQLGFNAPNGCRNLTLIEYPSASFPRVLPLTRFCPFEPRTDCLGETVPGALALRDAREGRRLAPGRVSWRLKKGAGDRAADLGDPTHRHRLRALRLRRGRTSVCWLMLHPDALAGPGWKARRNGFVFKAKRASTGRPPQGPPAHRRRRQGARRVKGKGALLDLRALPVPQSATILVQLYNGADRAGAPSSAPTPSSTPKSASRIAPTDDLYEGVWPGALATTPPRPRARGAPRRSGSSRGSETRKRTTFATSSGWQTRPKGMCRSSSRRSSTPRVARTRRRPISVSTRPGATTFDADAVAPLLLREGEGQRLHRRLAHAVGRAVRVVVERRDARDEHHVAARPRRASPAARGGSGTWGPKAWTRTTRSSSSGSVSATLCPRLAMPALCTSRSTGPSSACDRGHHAPRSPRSRRPTPRRPRARRPRARIAAAVSSAAAASRR